MRKLLLVITALFLFTSAHAQSPSACSSMVYGGVFPASKEPVQIICHQRYVVGFSTTRHTPLWVAEQLTATEVGNEGHGNRVCTFTADPAVPSNEQGSPKAYAGTTYDKGHMANYEDANDNSAAAGDTCVFTNAVPQASSNNRGIWRSLEGDVRKLANTKGSVFIVTGPIFDGSPATLADGTPIPTRLFKMILSPSTKEAWTVVMPNAQGMDVATLPNYVTTVQNLRVVDTLVDVLPNNPNFVDSKSLK